MHKLRVHQQPERALGTDLPVVSLSIFLYECQGDTGGELALSVTMVTGKVCPRVGGIAEQNFKGERKGILEHGRHLNRGVT